MVINDDEKVIQPNDTTREIPMDFEDVFGDPDPVTKEVPFEHMEPDFVPYPDNEPKTELPEEPDHMKNIPAPTEKDIPPEPEDVSPVEEAPLKNMAGKEITGQDEVAGPTPHEPEKEKVVEVQPIELYFPNMIPINGRIITIGIRMVEQKMPNGLYIVPKGITRDNYDRLRSNPNEDMMYFVVSMCPTVNHVFKAQGMLPKRWNQFVILEIGDQLVVSSNMEPIYHREIDGIGLREFWIWHHSDVLGFKKDPGNAERFDQQHGPKPKTVPFRKEK